MKDWRTTHRYDAIGGREVGKMKPSRSRNAPEWRGMKSNSRRRAAAPMKRVVVPDGMTAEQAFAEQAERRAAAAEARRQREEAYFAAQDAKAALLARLTELNRID